MGWSGTGKSPTRRLRAGQPPPWAWELCSPVKGLALTGLDQFCSMAATTGKRRSTKTKAAKQALRCCHIGRDAAKEERMVGKRVFWEKLPFFRSLWCAHLHTNRYITMQPSLAGRLLLVQECHPPQQSITLKTTSILLKQFNSK